ncbi:hypothetical protein G7B40_037830 [Aetokthonos hydrillicola Thurmond2011]|uniref:Uncharacterized protein n=1 Tax=Aetokthonos hydrillicola Thurmond2011 TaxID=2712845 RepID=A0AAP5IFF2_9CYAN|nr:hypothetical protein [Aetokthonos hydrillicola]MBO3463282.1 hypothetical protein [Aetokthonos hydrillicola CCALA 1050]MBW4589773.1 hypothetical protein [Aetokthonos hydrillicola CCALA 1050]MDR9900269.1 hypothetical protein [Aetokthonos hydrillicola Thurmond2011]
MLHHSLAARVPTRILSIMSTDSFGFLAIAILLKQKRRFWQEDSCM